MADSDAIIAYAVLGLLGLVVLLMFLIGYCAECHGLRNAVTPGHEFCEVTIEHGNCRDQETTV